MNPYDVLGVSKSDDTETIRKAYRRKARKAHPDRGGGSNSRMADINGAYALLSDPAAAVGWGHVRAHGGVPMNRVPHFNLGPPSLSRNFCLTCQSVELHKYGVCVHCSTPIARAEGDPGSPKNPLSFQQRLEIRKLMTAIPKKNRGAAFANLAIQYGVSKRRIAKTVNG